MLNENTSEVKIGRSIGTQTEPNTNSRIESETNPQSAKAVFQDLLGVRESATDSNDDLTNTFYQRDLPSSLVRFASPEGKKLFREAMDENHAEGFFPLTGNFTTQSEPAYCGPSSLAMVLNALEVDPKRRWKGNWRWYSDEFLHCCTSQEDVKKNGITFDNFACLAECHSTVEVNRAFEFTFEKFKKDIEMVTSSSDKFIVISFSRKALDQTGDGHFSPLGAYNAKEGMVLVLDTARYKYPSYWVPIEALFKSMQPIDKETGRPRGYFVLSYNSEHPPVTRCVPNDQQQANLKEEGQGKAKLDWSILAKSFCQRIPEDMWLEKPRSLEHVVELVLRNVPKEYTTILASESIKSFNATSPGKAEEYINELLDSTTKSALYPIVLDALYPNRQNQSYHHVDLNAAFATLFVLGSPSMLYTSLPRELQERIDSYRKDERMAPVMKHEIHRISEEVIDLITTFCTCGPGWSTGKDLAEKSAATNDNFEQAPKYSCCKTK